MSAAEVIEALRAINVLLVNSQFIDNPAIRTKIEEKMIELLEKL